MVNRKRYDIRRKRRKLNKKIAIVTDGTLTEYGYFQILNRLIKDSIKIYPKTGKDIDELVQEAIRLNNPNFEFDYVAVVCDIDQRLETEKNKN